MIGLRVWTIAFGAIGGHRKTAVFPHARERRDDHRANLRQLARDERRRERLPEKDRDVEPIVDETAPRPSLNQFRRPPGMAIEATCRERRREQPARAEPVDVHAQAAAHRSRCTGPSATAHR
ncbi:MULTISPECIES: hypothetical protein [Burkholderia]|uniref:hypothetical protein n=1 Tax=Burkholderia TaxID=32008 RepID=UPI0012E3A60F|nr:MULTISPECIES: hypothetical protein [Burkholderia]